MFCEHFYQYIDDRGDVLYAFIDGPASWADSAVMQNSGH